MKGKPISDIEQLSIEVNEVYNLLVNINPHKTTGPDGIPARLLKETAYQMAPLLTFIKPGVCVCVCLCVSAPKAMNNQWRDVV